MRVCWLRSRRSWCQEIYKQASALSLGIRRFTETHSEHLVAEHKHQRRLPMQYKLEGRTLGFKRHPVLFK
jgi:hypothetical protein